MLRWKAITVNKILGICLVHSVHSEGLQDNAVPVIVCWNQEFGDRCSLYKVWHEIWKLATIERNIAGLRVSSGD